jgi:hypothetical protein
VLLATVLGALPFLPSLAASYLADDWFFVAAYAGAREPFGDLVWRALSTLGGTPTTFYRPLPFVSLALQLRLDQSAAALHVVNLGLHALTTGLLAAMALRLTGGATAASVVATLAFAWFPRRVEAVAWLSCRPDLCAAWFALLSIFCFERLLRRRRSMWGGASLVFWWLALLSKESALLVPIVHLTLLAWSRAGTAPVPTEPCGRVRGTEPPRDGLEDSSAARPRPPWRWLLPFAVSMPVYVLCRRAVVGSWIGGYGAGVFAVGTGGASAAAKHAAYQLLPPLEWLEPAMRAGRLAWLAATLVLVVIVCLGLVVWRLRRDGAARVGLALAAAGGLPALTLPVSLTTTFNDRLLYLPALGVALIGAALCSRIRRERLVAGGAAVLALLFVWSWSLSTRWATAGTISDRTLAALAGALERETASRVYLAAVPDSMGGAYLLRNGVREAMQVFGTAGPDRVATLALYFIAPGAVPARPVHAIRRAPLVVQLESVGVDPQVMVGTPDATGRATYEASATLDRFGRRRGATIHLHEPGAVWLVGPGWVEDIR